MRVNTDEIGAAEKGKETYIGDGFHARISKLVRYWGLPLNAELDSGAGPDTQYAVWVYNHSSEPVLDDRGYQVRRYFKGFESKARKKLLLKVCFGCSVSKQISNQ